MDTLNNDQDSINHKDTMLRRSLSLVGILCGRCLVYSWSPLLELVVERRRTEQEQVALEPRWEAQQSQTSTASISRRTFVHRQIATIGITLTVQTGAISNASAAASRNDTTIRYPVTSGQSPTSFLDDIRHPFSYSSQWTGTCLPWLSLAAAAAATMTPITVDSAAAAVPCWPMAQWPDPILRRSAQNVPDAWFGTNALHRACQSLQATALVYGAVGLAAQQCGVNARIVYLQLSKLRSNSAFKRTGSSFSSLSSLLDRDDCLFMVNPRITARSPETEMRVWTENCLVLPPTFTATVFRDAWIQVSYLDWSSPDDWHSVRLTGETARAAQHELDHDRGILVTDHVALDELESETMRRIERPGHESRMAVAYTRYIG
jgi:peptide deformylase